MPIISFTEDDRAEAMLPLLTDEHPGDVTIRIEDADECEGITCGKGLESALSRDDYARYLDCHAAAPPMALHSHIVVRGRAPATRSVTAAVLKG